jgi:hypothetical protein
MQEFLQSLKRVCVPVGGKFKAEALKQANISTSTANRYEKIAEIPE